ncbi:kinase-like domain-containing protein [Pilobolus umbonatus]|nr:kinase-like domain-containing protein [Pilobolus umbonatus]
MVPDSPQLAQPPEHNNEKETRDHHRNVPAKSIGNFQLQQSIGKGSMGKVKLGVHNVTGEKIAVKIVPRANLQLFSQPAYISGKSIQQITKEKAREENREVRTIREAHIMMLLRHPNIVGLRDLIQQGPYFYILMDFVNGGQLLHYIVKRQRLSDRRTRLFARQIISALDYLHRNSIVHRDLKIENIMIDKNGRTIKIIDFGLSNLFCPERQLTTYCGSLYFAAPELLKASPYKGPEVDIWSLGVVIYVMATGSVPFDDRSMAGLHDKIKKGVVSYPAHLSKDCRDLLSKIFVTDPKKRINMTDIVHHPWLNKESTPIKNYMPTRKKITMPLDPKVLQRVSTGFNLGTADDVERRLKLIVQSPVYEEAMDHISHLQNNPPPSKVVYDDPQSVPAAYHPYLSLYYLASERLIAIEKESQQRVAIKHTSLSRQGSIESIGGNSSARSSQGSLVAGNESQEAVHPPENRPLIEVPISHTPLLPIPQTTASGIKLQGSNSAVGLMSQPAAIGSTNYLSRIQRWLRSSFSQHHLATETTPPSAPPSPPQHDADAKHTEVEVMYSGNAHSTTLHVANTNIDRLLTPSHSADYKDTQSPHDMDNTTLENNHSMSPTLHKSGSKSLFRKLSHAILNRSSSKSLNKKPSNVSNTNTTNSDPNPSEEEIVSVIPHPVDNDIPPPVPPKDIDYSQDMLLRASRVSMARQSQLPPPGMSIATISSRQTAHTLDVQSLGKYTPRPHQYPNTNHLEPVQPTPVPVLTRSSSLAGYAHRRRGSVSKLTGKIGSWISRSASLNQHKHYKE